MCPSDLKGVPSFVSVRLGRFLDVPYLLFEVEIHLFEAVWFVLVQPERRLVAARTATFTVLTPYNVVPQHRNQPHPTLPANIPHTQ